jgi:hypothetical protein
MIIIQNLGTKTERAINDMDLWQSVIKKSTKFPGSQSLQLKKD